jgi:hypothetical protein
VKVRAMMTAHSPVRTAARRSPLVKHSFASGIRPRIFC